MPMSTSKDDAPLSDVQPGGRSEGPGGTWQLDVEPPSDSLSESAPVESAGRKRSPRPAASPHAPPPLLRILEAMLFVSRTPLTAQRAAEVIRGLTPDQFEEIVAQLNRSYREQGRPYLIKQHEGGKVLMLRPRYRFVVEKLYGGPREARLSQAAVEVLSIVAYRQPVTRADIESLRGKDSAAPLRQLVRLGLIEVVGRAEGGGSAVRYGTTPRFLELFGLSRLEDLPESDDLSRL